MARNAMFTGRKGELLALADALLYAPEGGTSLAITAQGIGDVGKTQLATELAYCYGRFSPAVSTSKCDWRSARRTSLQPACPGYQGKGLGARPR